MKLAPFIGISEFIYKSDVHRSLKWVISQNWDLLVANISLENDC